MAGNAEHRLGPFAEMASCRGGARRSNLNRSRENGCGFFVAVTKKDDRGLVCAFNGAHGSDYAKASTDRVKRPTKSQTRFGEIDVLLNAAENFVADDFFIAELQNRIAFLF